jgi:hypothetical protein
MKRNDLTKEQRDELMQALNDQTKRDGLSLKERIDKARELGLLRKPIGMKYAVRGQNPFWGPMPEASTTR